MQFAEFNHFLIIDDFVLMVPAYIICNYVCVVIAVNGICDVTCYFIIAGMI